MELPICKPIIRSTYDYKNSIYLFLYHSLSNIRKYKPHYYYELPFKVYIQWAKKELQILLLVLRYRYQAAHKIETFIGSSENFFSLLTK